MGRPRREQAVHKGDARFIKSWCSQAAKSARAKGRGAALSLNFPTGPKRPMATFRLLGKHLERLKLTLGYPPLVHAYFHGIGLDETTAPALTAALAHVRPVSLNLGENDLGRREGAAGRHVVDFVKRNPCLGQLWSEHQLSPDHDGQVKQLLAADCRRDRMWASYGPEEIQRICNVERGHHQGRRDTVVPQGPVAATKDRCPGENIWVPRLVLPLPPPQPAPPPVRFDAFCFIELPPEVVGLVVRHLGADAKWALWSAVVCSDAVGQRTREAWQRAIEQNSHLGRSYGTVAHWW